MRKFLYHAGRALGMVCGVGAAAAWVAAMWFPEWGLPLEGVTLVVGMLMLVLAVIAILASLHGHGIVLILVFLASFLPVGLHLLALANWFQLIGWLDIGLLLAGLLVWAGSRARNARPAPEEQG